MLRRWVAVALAFLIVALVEPSGAAAATFRASISSNSPTSTTAATSVDAGALREVQPHNAGRALLATSTTPATGLSTAITVGEAGAVGSWATPAAVLRRCVAAEAGTSGGAAAVRLGQAGEDAVRGAYDIGPKFTADIGGRTRIFDGLSNEAVSEVKNVASQAYTQQLKDSLAYAQGNGLRFDLYVRPDTYLTGPLRDAISGGFINLRYIP